MSITTDFRAKVGDTRTVVRFALLPKKMSDCGWIWLKPYFSQEEFVESFMLVPDVKGGGYPCTKWFVRDKTRKMK